MLWVHDIIQPETGHGKAILVDETLRNGIVHQVHHPLAPDRPICV